MNRKHFEDLEYNAQAHDKAQATSWEQPARNAARFAKQSLFRKFVTFILNFF